MHTISCAIVGYGGIARFHTRAFSRIPGVRLRTVIGRRAEPAESFREAWGFDNATTSYEEALADPDIDAVVIASPSEVHYEQTRLALEAGKNVLVEIPVALSHKGAAEIAGLAKKSGNKLLVAHTRRFNRTGRFVKDFLANGQAGHVHQHHTNEFQLRRDNVGWTGYRRSWTDDVLFHHGCHVLDYSLWTIDSPVRRIRGELSPLDAGTGTSLDVSMLLRYTTETIAALSLSYNARAGVSSNFYLCDAGTLVVSGNQVTLNGKTLFESDDTLEDDVLVQNTEFIESIRKNRQPECGAERALEALGLLQQVYDQSITLEQEDKYKRMWEI
ncbi:MAG: Gfo/Idh/MocA family oxidoreductase [Candidatus Latescibacteria bacterium]|nr:Gfo/Idh/MocA family oxidoreductase [Candidatus Latescibacterota bacterium]